MLASAAESTIAVLGRDFIQDFSRAEGDRIDLSLIDAKAAIAGNQAFRFLGSNAFGGHAGELRFEVVTGGTLVMGDKNGDRNADFAIFVQGTSFEAKDFML